MAEQITYAQAGVDVAEGARAVQAIKGIVNATRRDEVVGDIGGFGGLFSIGAAKEMDDPLLVSGTDGVGTKLKLAQMLGVHNTVGIDLVAMCANDILATGAEPLFFLDYIAVGKLEAEAVRAIVEGIGEGCRLAGCALIGGEMAEHPGVMDPTDYDLSGFCVGLVDRPKMLGPQNVREGDMIVGIASSGLHSNGYSLVRRVCVEERTVTELSAPLDEFDGASLLEALLAPTRIYVKPVLDAVAAYPGAIHSLAHITGGGITENLDRALPKSMDAIVELGTWKPSPIVEYVCAAASLSQQEALKTFNMGLGMMLIVDEAAAPAVRDALVAAGEEAWIVGYVMGEGSGSVSFVHADDGRGTPEYVEVAHATA